eukprot:gene8134-16710_t
MNILQQLMAYNAEWKNILSPSQRMKMSEIHDSSEKQGYLATIETNVTNPSRLTKVIKLSSMSIIVSRLESYSRTVDLYYNCMNNTISNIHQNNIESKYPLVRLSVIFV